MSVFLADMTALKSRMVIFGINATPSIATTFAGPAIAQEFLDHSTWRWAFGVFCIIMPAVTVPVLVSFIINRQKAKRMGMVIKRSSGRTWSESIKYYVIEFDGISRGFPSRSSMLTTLSYRDDSLHSRFRPYPSPIESCIIFWE